MKTKFTTELVCFYLLSWAFCLSAWAQGTAFTYQGRVTDNGTNFTGAGHFKFALVTSTNANHTATATANTPSGGYITGYTVTDGGNGYVTAPAVTVFGGGGSGATAHPNLSGSVVTGLTVDNTGDGNYTSAPMVMIAPPHPNISYTTCWSNDGTSTNGSEPTAAVNVFVNNGLFLAVLGDTAVPNMAAIGASLFSQPNLQLRIWFNDGVNGFTALDPVQNLTPTPYAITANMANGLPGLSVQQNSSGAPNMIGGASVNYVSNTVVGATIGGGGATNYGGYNFPNLVTANFGTVGGGLKDTAGGTFATVSGGDGNTASGQWATVGGGDGNTASGQYATVGGGNANTASSQLATVSGGSGNTATNSYATVSGGDGNIAGGDYSTVSGGSGNNASGFDATVSGGDANTASGLNATVGGGEGNTASGNYSFAAGYKAQALHSGSFVWSDASFGSFSSTAVNQFSVRASGGIRLAGDVQLDSSTYHFLSLSGGNALGYLYGSFPAFADGIHLGYNYYADANGIGHISNAGGATSRLTAGYGFVAIDVGGVDATPTTQRLLANSTGVSIGALNPGHLFQVGNSGSPAYCDGGTWVNGSDRNSKDDFAAINPGEVLEKVAAMPITEWQYKAEPGQEHIGPMAQDFHAAFGLNGSDDKHISTVDEGGVAFAAIQGLNRKLEASTRKSDAQIQKLEAENAELKQRLEVLEQIILKQKSK